MDRSLLSSNEGVALVCCGENKVLTLFIHLRSNPHLWSYEPWQVERGPGYKWLRRVVFTWCLGSDLWSSITQGARSRRSSSSEGFSWGGSGIWFGYSLWRFSNHVSLGVNQKEDPGFMEGLCILSDLELLVTQQEELAGEGVWVPIWTFCLCDLNTEEDGWMNLQISSVYSTFEIKK